MLAQDLLPRSQPWIKSPNLSETSQVIGSIYSPPFSPANITRMDSRVAEALNARDVVVQRLADACVSIRQKTAVIERLEKEKVELQETLVGYTAPGMSEQKGDVEAATWEKLVCDLQEEIKALKIGRKDEYDDVALCAFNSLENSPKVGDEGSDAKIPASDSLFKTTDDPEERLKARHALLATLPLPTNIPFDALRPIVIPSTLDIHEFIGTTPNLIRNQLVNFRVFQQLTTAWCPEREEHGYFLTPAFKCNTSSRTVTAHNWAAVDATTGITKPTECFYRREGNWYYAGIYKAVKLDDLTASEWNNLSNETTQAIIRDTLAGRKTTSPQNIYETAQLYAVGALRVACVGLQCVGFNDELYRAVLEHAVKFNQGAKWKAGRTMGGTGWNVQANGSPPITVCGVGGNKSSMSFGGADGGEGKENATCFSGRFVHLISGNAEITSPLRSTNFRLKAMQEDPELAAIRAARLSQLQQNGGGGDNEEENKQRATAAAAEAQMRRDLLATVLDAPARERLARIGLVSPDRSRQIEGILLRMAQTGQLRGKVNEEQLIDLLEQADEAHSKANAKKGSIVFQRRRDLDDDDFDI